MDRLQGLLVSDLLPAPPSEPWLAPASLVYWCAALCLAGAAARFLRALWEVLAPAIFGSCCRPNLKRRYGDGAFAVVTGGTDGIGWAYANEFARDGVNVMLISRTKAKLERRAAELSEKYPGVQVKFVAADLSKISAGGEILRRVQAALGGIDVGCLVNNCGISYEHPEYLSSVDDEIVNRILNVNIRALTLITRCVLPSMVAARKTRDIINVTSVAGVWYPGWPMVTLYSASKGFVNFFSRSLHHELAGKNVHVQCHVPHLVATAMAKVKPAWPMIPSPQAYARAALNRLGGNFMITPWWAHDIQERLVNSLPLFISSRIILSDSHSVRKRALRKKAILAFEAEYRKDHPEIDDMEERARRKLVRAEWEKSTRKEA